MTPVMDVPHCASPRVFNADGSLVLLDGRILCTPNGPNPSPIRPLPDADLRSRVVEVASGEEVLDLGERLVMSGNFNPAGEFDAGRYLALNIDMGNGAGVEVYDMSSGELLGGLAVDEGVLAVKFDRRGRFMAVATGENRAIVLDLAAMVAGASAEDAVVFDRIAHTGASTRVALTDDGRLMTAGHGDGLVRLWDISTGDLLVEFRFDRIDGPALGSPWVDVSPDGYALYSDAGGILRRFLLDTDDLIELAESRVTRGFTPDECRQYFGTEDC
jgi:WD40 repeat protein